METAPQPEKIAPQEKKVSGPYHRLVKDLFKKFRDRPDQPKYSYAEQHELAIKSERAQTAAQKEKTEDALKLAEAAAVKFMESKEDKKHISTVWAPLLAAKLYLESEEPESLTEEQKKELLGKVENLYVGLEIAREKENISDELIEKVLGVMDEIEINLK